MPKSEECRYMKSHEWAFLDGEKVWIGISDHAQKEITDVVFVEMPKIGRKVLRGEAVGAIESVKAAFDIYSPLSGEITTINEEVSKDPSVVNQSPHEKGWLFQIKPADKKELESLMDWSHYQEFLKAGAH
jgi:glycine cleavage system H protein